MKWLLSLVLLSLFIAQPSGYVRNDSDNGRNNQPGLDTQPVTSGLTSTAKSSNERTVQNSIESPQNDPARELTPKQYVTPDDQAVKALAGGIIELKDIYDTASRWIYISDEELNLSTDKWLTPHEFLVNTPYYANNPVQGKAVSDCEEKANTLVSLFRARGIKPEDVRVVLGEVSFNGVKTGHAWVELFYEGRWLALDPSWGPYWNEKTGKLVNRKAVPFDYYSDHTYPVVQVWVYYNDAYYLDPRDNAGNFPDSWCPNHTS